MEIKFNTWYNIHNDKKLFNSFINQTRKLLNDTSICWPFHKIIPNLIMLNSKYGNFAYRSNWIEKYISKDKVIEYDVPSTCAAHDDSVDAFLYSITKDCTILPVLGKYLRCDDMLLQTKNKLKKGNIKMNELIEKWYEVREEELTKAYKNTNRKIRLDTPVGKAALAYSEEITKMTGRITDVDYLIHDDMLSLETKDKLKKENTDYYKQLNELRAKRDTITNLFEMCDTFEQKLDILTRYKIVELPKKIGE